MFIVNCPYGQSVYLLSGNLPQVQPPMDLHGKPACQPVKTPQTGEGALSTVSCVCQPGCKERGINPNFFSTKKKFIKNFLNAKKFPKKFQNTKKNLKKNFKLRKKFEKFRTL